MDNKQKKYIIIGASAAGISALKVLRKKDPHASIICITQEKEIPYNKCFLADALAHKRAASDLSLIDTQSNDPLTTFLLETQVVALDLDNSLVVCHNGKQFFYDKLLLAMGSSARIPPFAGKEEALVVPFHSMANINYIDTLIAKRCASHVTVIGAGINGLECVDALLARNIAVTLIEKSAFAAQGVADKAASDLIRTYLYEKNVDCHFESTIEHVQPLASNKGFVVQLSSGKLQETSFIISAAGITPNSTLAQASNLTLVNNHIKVDRYLQTSHHNIYAAGDLITVPHKKTGVLTPSSTWPDAMHQGLTVGHTMSGDAREYPTIAPFITSSFFGLSCLATGLAHIPSNAKKTTVTVTHSEHEAQWSDANNRLLGFIILGKPAAYAAQIRRSFLSQD